MPKKKEKLPATSIKERKSHKIREPNEVILAESKLRFCPDQLINLNYILKKKLERVVDLEKEKSTSLARSVAERLIQRLLCGAGMLDERFSSKYLVEYSEEYEREEDSRNLKYYVILDNLSKPPLYVADNIPQYEVVERDPEYPQGYARIRLNSSTYKTWAEFINSGGYLRRDKLQARFVQLLAQAASSDIPSTPTQIDESIFCASPGKIIDPYTFHKISSIPSERQIFYGVDGNAPRFPDPRDFRLAIIDEQEGVRIRVEFLSPALSAYPVSIRLLLTISINAWPSTASFPLRVPLCHSDSLIYHKVAQTGSFLVSYGIHTSAFQLRFPAAEIALIRNYSESSTVRTILNVLYAVLREIQNEAYLRKHVAHEIINRHLLKICLFQELERDSCKPTQVLINWSPKYLSSFVLKILDDLIASLENQNLPCYFFPKANLLSNPGHLCEDDYIVEANKLRMYLVKLFDESLTPTRDNLEFQKMSAYDDMETVLLYKWKELVDGLLPPSSTRGRRFCFNSSNAANSQYTKRQLDYVGLLLKNMLCVKQNLMQTTEKLPWPAEMRIQETKLEIIEDIVYVLASIMEQARDQFLSNYQDNKDKLRINFDVSTSKLLELVRKDKDLLTIDLSDDDVLVKTILKWLYKGLDHNKKYLAPILRPYLNGLFSTSYAISWHIEHVQDVDSTEEMEAIGAFAELVNDVKLTPARGLIDAVNKNWNWAKAVLEMVEKTNLRMIFTPERGKVFRHILLMPNKKKPPVDRNRRKTIDVCQTTLQFRSVFLTMLNKGKIENEYSKPIHYILKEQNPLSVISKKFHRNGDHRCCGDIIQILLSSQKGTILQEASNVLPPEDRAELMDAVSKLQAERQRKSINRKWSNTLPQLSRSFSQMVIANSSKEPAQKYIKKEESAGIGIEEMSEYDGGSRRRELWRKFECEREGSLIGSCRAARLRQDNSILHFQENFKVKSLLRMKDSFKI